MYLTYKTCPKIKQGFCILSFDEVKLFNSVPRTMNLRSSCILLVLLSLDYYRPINLVMYEYYSVLRF